MPAQHQPHMKEREPNGKGAKTVKAPSKESQSGPQNPGKKKAGKKKKKKASQDNGKHPSQSKKQSVFEKSPLELLHPQSDDGRPRDDSTKVIPGQTSGNPLFASASAFSFLTQGDSKVSNESLRWDGILDDPIAEEERLQNYRLNRRKRYGEYIQQNLPPEPSFTLRNLPQLCKVAQKRREDTLPKSKSSASTSSGQQKPKETEF